MEDSKDQIKESSGSFNKPEPIEKKTFNDLMRLKLEIDYQQLPMIDTDLLEKVMEGKQGKFVGHAYKYEAEREKIFVLITEEDLQFGRYGKLRGYCIFLCNLRPGNGAWYTSFNTCDFNVDNFNKIRVIEGHVCYETKKEVFKEIPVEEFSKLYSACRTIMEIRSKL